MIIPISLLPVSLPYFELLFSLPGTNSVAHTASASLAFEAAFWGSTPPHAEGFSWQPFQFTLSKIETNKCCWTRWCNQRPFTLSRTTALFSFHFVQPELRIYRICEDTFLGWKIRLPKNVYQTFWGWRGRAGIYQAIESLTRSKWFMDKNGDKLITANRVRHEIMYNGKSHP